MDTTKLSLPALAIIAAMGVAVGVVQTSPQPAPAVPPAASAPPVPGANSFTEGEARSRIEASGFTEVTDLQKDEQSIWRGKAMKEGKPVIVSLDFQGHVVAE